MLLLSKSFNLLIPVITTFRLLLLLRIMSIFFFCSDSRISYNEIISSNSITSNLSFVLLIQLFKSFSSIISPFCVKKYEISKTFIYDNKDPGIGNFRLIFSKLPKKEVVAIFLRDFPKIIFSGNKCPYSSNTFCKALDGFILSSAFSIALLNSSEGFI
ncbi:hypothetical protein C1646_707726 [Rhizophagus diaphanus]|nr:hypothetical protein C1646_707726 [Rhizophagus diaphanus] [Rhizophagus sp. MUCL 43196]